MPAPWSSWRKILSCRQDLDCAVHDPKGPPQDPDCAVHDLKASRPPSGRHDPAKVHHAVASAKPMHARKRTSSSSCCSKSACNNIKNVIHSNHPARVAHRSESESPPPLMKNQSSRSPHMLKAITDQDPMLGTNPVIAEAGAEIYNTKAMHIRKISGCYDCSSITLCQPPGLLPQNAQPAVPRNSLSCSHPSAQALCCTKCGDNFSKPEAFEEHHATFHAVLELQEGDSARSIVEIIFQTSWLRKDIPRAKPERIFKVLNSPKTVAKFEEYRDMVKAKASKLISSRTRHYSRCQADGNELLRFYSTTVSCSLAKPWSSSSSLCSSITCGVCQVLRSGFPIKGQPGIFTTGSSGKAHDSIFFLDDDNDCSGAGESRRAMLVCRVIAGRVKRLTQETSQDGPGALSGYDSFAGEAGQYSNLEELLVFNPRAVLPCFVVIYSY